MSQIPSPSNHFSGPTRLASELVSMAPTVPALLPPFDLQNVWMRPMSGATSTTSTAMPRRTATRASFTLAADLAHLPPAAAEHQPGAHPADEDRRRPQQPRV